MNVTGSNVLQNIQCDVSIHFANLRDNFVRVGNDKKLDVFGITSIACRQRSSISFFFNYFQYLPISNGVCRGSLDPCCLNVFSVFYCLLYVRFCQLSAIWTTRREGSGYRGIRAMRCSFSKERPLVLLHAQCIALMHGISF